MCEQDDLLRTAEQKDQAKTGAALIFGLTGQLHISRSRRDLSRHKSTVLTRIENLWTVPLNT
jgi:hypothetical protein